MNIYDILFWVFFVLSIAVVIWIILGDSPTVEQGVLVMIVTLMWSMNNRLTRLEMRFDAVAKDVHSLVEEKQSGKR